VRRGNVPIDPVRMGALVFITPELSAALPLVLRRANAFADVGRDEVLFFKNGTLIAPLGDGHG
jgi:hypothetical protein